MREQKTVIISTRSSQKPSRLVFWVSVWRSVTLTPKCLQIEKIQSAKGDLGASALTHALCFVKLKAIIAESQVYGNSSQIPYRWWLGWPQDAPVIWQLAVLDILSGREKRHEHSLPLDDLLWSVSQTGDDSPAFGRVLASCQGVPSGEASVGERRFWLHKLVNDL